jgi:predicted NUDIX family NTP pyrophosphohydrolase
MTTTLQPVVHIKDREYTVFVDTWEDGIRVFSEEIGFCVSQKEAVKLLEEAGCDGSSIAYAFSTAEDV